MFALVFREHSVFHVNENEVNETLNKVKVTAKTKFLCGA